MAAEIESYETISSSSNSSSASSEVVRVRSHDLRPSSGHDQDNVLTSPSLDDGDYEEPSPAPHRISTHAGAVSPTRDGPKSPGRSVGLPWMPARRRYSLDSTREAEAEHAIESLLGPEHRNRVHDTIPEVDSSNSRSPMFVSMGADTYSGGTGMDGLNGIGSGGTTGTTGTTTSGRKVFVPPVITRPAANGKGAFDSGEGIGRRMSSPNHIRSDDSDTPSPATLYMDLIDSVQTLGSDHAPPQLRRRFSISAGLRMFRKNPSKSERSTVDSANVLRAQLDALSEGLFNEVQSTEKSLRSASKVSMESMLKMSMNPLTLHFRSEDASGRAGGWCLPHSAANLRERVFASAKRQKDGTSHLAAYGLLIAMCLGVLMIRAITPDLDGVYPIGVAVGVFMICAVYSVSSWTAWGQTHEQFLLGLAYTIAACSFLVVGLQADRNTVLIPFICLSLMALLQPPLLFYNAVVVAWVNGFAYILWVFLLHPWFRAASESIILFTTLLGATATAHSFRWHERNHYMHLEVMHLIQAEIHLEQKRHSTLLAAILPANIAEELKNSTKRRIWYRREEVTILFADVKGFTKMSERVGPERLVGLLDDLFRRFDHLAVQHQLEKIKTIGDCYMCASNLQMGAGEPPSKAAGRVAKFALDMLQVIAEFNAFHATRFELRVGFHTGTVVAGVIGSNKFCFDVWGVDVGLASRMESTGVPGRVQVSAASMARLKEYFDFAPYQTLDLPGRPRTDTFFLLRRKVIEPSSLLTQLAPFLQDLDLDLSESGAIVPKDTLEDVLDISVTAGFELPSTGVSNTEDSGANRLATAFERGETLAVRQACLGFNVETQEDSFLSQALPWKRGWFFISIGAAVLMEILITLSEWMTLEASETSDFDSTRLAIRLLGPGVLLVALVVVAFIPCLLRFVYLYDVCLGFAVIVLEVEFMIFTATRPELIPITPSAWMVITQWGATFASVHLPVAVVHQVIGIIGINVVIGVSSASEKVEMFDAFIFNVFLMTMAAVGCLFVGHRISEMRTNHLLIASGKQQTRHLLRESDKSKKVLLNILPEPIYRRLSKRGHSREAIAERHDSVTVSFVKLKNFDRLIDVLRPEEYVALLDAIFRTFDAIATRHGIEKIKTIGVTYMVVAGLPNPCRDHAQRVARFAVDIRDRFSGLIGSLTDLMTLQSPIALQIGINSGPVVAGVIGLEKPIYDIWGDTANTASRMQSHCPLNAIQVTAATFELVRGAFGCAPRGPVEIKSKGMLNTFLVTRARTYESGQLESAQLESSGYVDSEPDPIGAHVAWEDGL